MSALSFLVVGTPRSGTTLTQRLCCELPGVAMPPETHFLHRYAPRLLARRRFPLSRGEVERELEDFRHLPTSAGLRLDTGEVLDLVGRRCDTLLDLFAAVVVALCPPAARYGEKTPEHLLWWRPLAEADPRLRLVGVVRDPRAVAVSHRSVPWGIEDATVLAEEWALDQRQLRAAARHLGPGRCLLLRYEDVVADPDGARERLAELLAVRPGGPAAAPPPAGIVHGWEWWKSSALQAVTTERTAAWREVLPPADIAAIEEVAGAEMAAYGYLDRPPARRRRAGTEVRDRLSARLYRVRRLAPLAFGRPAPRATPRGAGPA
ncbi:sulfotransferase [Phytohabitans sp. ZYX-F-186]|uniref:Sulfotransferase n=1 Tax=Phytohabitans maris TaxID=3071409 RepID=A0ABU0ZEU3_9ACTN|nr:sulfotransferase [Phytohabitans sp. ZYX-F-186]MDQ7904971.1 sulfotransferase [Phytohabitans sp. ZYX-F-186]